MIERLFGFAFLLATGYLLALLVLVGYTVRTLTRPPRRTCAWAISRKRPSDPSELVPPRKFRAFTFKSRNLELAAWELEGDLATGPTIIITCGWGESKVTMLDRAVQLAPLASTIILWDLPGHGESKGTSSLGAHESEDLITLAHLLPPRELFFYGYSLGAGIAIEAAARDQIPHLRGVIAEAPYRAPITPARNVLLQIGVPHRVNLPLAMMIIGLDLGYGLDFGTSKLYDRVSHAKNSKLPLLVLHGASDAICPPEDGKEIAQAAKGRFVMISGADHVNLWSLESSRKQAFSVVQAFCLDALSTRTIDHAKPVEQPSR